MLHSLLAPVCCLCFSVSDIECFGRIFIYSFILATILAIVCLILVIATLIWKTFIEMRLIEEEKELYRQLVDDDYRPSWHQVLKKPRKKSKVHDEFVSPPPYDRHSGRTNN